jgi:hypothetical protein
MVRASSTTVVVKAAEAGLLKPNSKPDQFKSEKLYSFLTFQKC